MSQLRIFKIRFLVKLAELEEELKSKYPGREKRIQYIVYSLAEKCQNLRTYTLSDFLFTLHWVSREFPEFKKLIPSSEEVEKLLKGKQKISP